MLRAAVISRAPSSPEKDRWGWWPKNLLSVELLPEPRVGVKAGDVKTACGGGDAAYGGDTDETTEGGRCILRAERTS